MCVRKLLSRASLLFINISCDIIWFPSISYLQEIVFITSYGGAFLLRLLHTILYIMFIVYSYLECSFAKCYQIM